MATALQRDLGVADPAALLAAEQAATKVDRFVRATLGDTFGGSWFDPATNRLVVGVTDARAATKARAAGADVRIVKRSERELKAAKARLDQVAGQAPEGVPGWYVDVLNNRVVVKYLPHARQQVAEWIATSRVEWGAVEVVESGERVRPLIDVVGGNRYWTSKYGCSVGFSVVGGFITAGHCGDVGETTTQPGGRFEGSSFPVDDMAFVRTDAGNIPVGAVNDYNGGRVAVAGAVEAPVGASICRSGGTTGWHCGGIRSRDATVDYGPSIGKVYQAIETTACAEPGDSGGSAISGNQAQGVTSGGSGDCKGGPATTYFQPVPEILRTYGVTLVTSDGGTPPGGCGTAATGNLSSTAVEPKSGYYEAAAGAHKGCLTGPANTDFDLYLQKWNGSSWRTVASGTGPTSTEKVSYTGTTGRYRWQLRAYSGSGQYTLESTTP
ncbi:MULTISPECIES: S1 family peptidase [unclassified Saccharothrix]|uniref:S1 family peptidase n=1 Tax=unclassified Saccharothrix TaxID=2593673 RepID=UPI00307DC160